MFSSQKAQRKEKNVKEKYYIYIWLSYRKYQRQSNLIKIS